MTEQDVIDRLFSTRDVTIKRIGKAQGMAQRHTLSWDQVLAAMTPEQRKAVEDAR